MCLKNSPSQTTITSIKGFLGTNAAILMPNKLKGISFRKGCETLTAGSVLDEHAFHEKGVEGLNGERSPLVRHAEFDESDRQRFYALHWIEDYPRSSR